MLAFRWQWRWQHQDLGACYDHDGQRIAELKNELDRTLEVSSEQLSNQGLTFTETAADLREADFHIVAVPTPIDDNNEPDLGPLKSASTMLSKVIKPGDLVVFESTVYPGCTEEICKPILESGSELLSPRDFVIGYSPERINPGDKAHNLHSVVKVVSAQTEEGLDIVESVYGSVVSAGLHRASSIRVAEAAKLSKTSSGMLTLHSSMNFQRFSTSWRSTHMRSWTLPRRNGTFCHSSLD